MIASHQVSPLVKTQQPYKAARLDREFAVTTTWHICRTLVLASSMIVTLCGCGSLHRRITVRSDPPRALVLVDGDEKGYTPMQMDFTYYGTREITLIKDGYETLNAMQKVRTPWYQIVPLDFFSDNFLPFKVTNRHEFSYQLQPQVVVPTGELLDRANAFRSEAQIGP